MSDNDPLDLLRAADPASEHSTDRPRMAADTLFEQITANTMSDESIRPDVAAADPSDVSSELQPLRRSRRWRPTIALPAAAAVAALVVGGAVLIEPGSTPSASALVAEAASTSAEFQSGRVAVTVDVVEFPGDDSSGSFMLDYRFDDGDFALSFETSMFAEVSDVDEEAVGDIDIRGIGDELFSSFDETASFVVTPRTEDTESMEALFGFRPTSMEPATVVSLLEETDDFEVVTSDDGTATYRGSVTVAALEALGPDSLPAGLSLIADPTTPNDDLPETLGVDVVVTDGLLDTLTIDIDGESELGDAKGTITTTFSEYGERQDIVAPPPDQVSDDAPVEFPVGMPDGFEEELENLNEVMSELETRRPGLCSDTIFAPEPGEVLDEEQFSQQLDAYPDCLEAAGEQDAADALRAWNEFVD